MRKKNPGTAIVVSNRLPFYLENGQGEPVWKKAAGGLITALEPFLLKENGIWLGWDGRHSTDTRYKKIALIEAKSLFSQANGQESLEGNYRVGCIPLSTKEVEGYYNQMSNCTLWSLFHYFFEKCSLDYEAWQTYCKVNQRFAAYISEVASNKDLVWIHDYHLFLVPYYLKKMRPTLPLHFFLHIPFPHSDIFSILPWGDQIIESLLCCRTVGFHHQQYCKNFEEAVAKYRSNKRKSRLGRGKGTLFYANPISVDYELINSTSQTADVIKRKEEIRKMFDCPKIIIGIDRIDYSKGIKERLLAIEKLIRCQPELRKFFYYYQLVVPSRESAEPYKILKREIDEIVGRINGLYSVDNWTPVHYHYGTLAFQDLIAHYAAADIALVTPLRDGMNLVSKEYIAACSDADGVLILSRFAGASDELSESLLVNPYAIKEVTEAITRAFHMSKRERKERMAAMRRKVQEHDIRSWLNTCFEKFSSS